MTTLVHIASQIKDCDIESFLDPNCKDENGNYSILVDFEEAKKVYEEAKKKNHKLTHATECVNDPNVKVVQITKNDIIAIKAKAARMKAKEASRGGFSLG